jgi:hypothetical protein
MVQQKGKEKSKNSEPCCIGNDDHQDKKDDQDLVKTILTKEHVARFTGTAVGFKAGLTVFN